MAKNQDTPELDRLVDSVLRGERVLMYPSGTAAFLLVNVLLVVGGATLVGAFVDDMLGPDPRKVAVAQMTGIALTLPLLVVAPTLVAFGRGHGLLAMRIMIGLWLLATLTALGLAVSKGVEATGAYVVALALFSAAMITVVRPSYITFVAYKRRLRTRREELRERASRGS